MNYTNEQIDIEVPNSLAMLTPQFLSQALHTEVHSVQILNDQVGSGMIGSIARIALEYEREKAEQPATLIAKFSAFQEPGRSLGNFLGANEREVRFYLEIAKNIKVRTPRCYFGAYGLQNQCSLLLLEDLSDYQNGNWQQGCSISVAKRVVQEIALLHAAWWNRPGLKEIPFLFHPKELFGSSSADEASSLWDRFRARMRLGDTPKIMRIGELIMGEVNGLLDYLEEPPITLIHNDTHLDNLFFRQSFYGSYRVVLPEVVVADWGLVMAAKGISDVAGFLCGNIETADRRSSEIEILSCYLDALIQGGVQGYSLEQCYTDYKKANLLIIWRMVNALVAAGEGGETIKGTQAEVFTANWGPIADRYLSAVADHYSIR